jgi:hypothetical protein
VYGFRVGIGCQVKVKFCSDRNAVDTSDVTWGTITVPIQGVLRGITGLGMMVCCNVTITADGLILKHHGMIVWQEQEVIALKVCVSGVHILGWQKSSNGCVNADRSVYRSLPQWGKHYLTTHHTQKMEKSENPDTPHLVHTNKLYLMLHAAFGWGACGMRAHNRNTNLMKCTDTFDFRLFFVVQLIAAGVL